MYKTFEQFWGHGVPLFSSTEDVNLLRELVEEFYFRGRMGVHELRASKVCRATLPCKQCQMPLYVCIYILSRTPFYQFHKEHPKNTNF